MKAHYSYLFVLLLFILGCEVYEGLIRFGQIENHIEVDCVVETLKDNELIKYRDHRIFKNERHSLFKETDTTWAHSFFYDVAFNKKINAKGTLEFTTKFNQIFKIKHSIGLVGGTFPEPLFDQAKEVMDNIELALQNNCQLKIRKNSIKTDCFGGCI